MTGYLKQYQSEQQDNQEGPRFFSDYAQSLADIAELYHEASRRKKFISDELRRSRYLQLADRYNHIVETIETEDDQRMERDEELQTADEIETLIRRWEQRKLPELEKQMAAIRKRNRKEREHGHAHNTNDKHNFRRANANLATIASTSTCPSKTSTKTTTTRAHASPGLRMSVPAATAEATTVSRPS